MGDSQFLAPNHAPVRDRGEEKEAEALICCLLPLSLLAPGGPSNSQSREVGYPQAQAGLVGHVGDPAL